MSRMPKSAEWVDVSESKSIGKVKPKLGNVLSLKGKPKLPKRRAPGSGPRRKGLGDVTLGDAAYYGKKAWDLAKHLATLINVENKVHDVDGTGGTSITTTPVVQNLSNIAQGTDYFNRDGDSILAQHIEFRAFLSGNTAATNMIARVLIVVDNEQQGVDPVLGDVLQGGTAPLVQPYNVFGLQRFTILYDELVALPNTVDTAATTYIPARVVLPKLIRKYNRHIKYDATAAADASNTEGAMYLMAVSTAASNGPNLSYTFRLVFTDN